MSTFIIFVVISFTVLLLEYQRRKMERNAFEKNWLCCRMKLDIANSILTEKQQKEAEKILDRVYYYEIEKRKQEGSDQEMAEWYSIHSYKEKLK